jgi:hypothetical protein
MNAEELRLRPEIEQPGNASTNPAPQAAEPPATASTTHPSPDPVLPSAVGGAGIPVRTALRSVPAIARTRAAADPIRDDRAPMILPPDAATIVAPRDVVEVVLEIYAERDVLRDSYETDDGISPEWYVAKIVRESSRALRAHQTGSDSNAGVDYRTQLVRIAGLAVRAIEDYDADQAEAQG